jgi:histidinol-phosphatase
VPAVNPLIHADAANARAEDLALALALANLADGITLDRFGALDLVVESKPDLTPVTDADRSVEQALRGELHLRRPDDALLGEEFGVSGPGAQDAAHHGRTWVIDPIDGTKNFVRGVPVWATLIALLVDGVPVLGVVSAPALGRRWWAATGSGAWLSINGAAPASIHVSKVSQLSDASVSYSSLDGWADRRRLDSLLALLRATWRSRAYGDFWSYMLVAEGAVDIAAEPELAIWDMGALAPIVWEAGGLFTALDGTPGVHGGAAAASNGLLHAEVLNLLGN